MDSRTHYKNMLLALLLILAGLAGAMAPQQAAAKEFVQIKIGGMTTTENFGTYYPVHIPGLRSGWIEYFTTTQHTKRALHLHDVVLDGDIEIEGADLTVVLYGKNKVDHIEGPKDIRITDGNSQNENSLDMGILKSEDGDIQIDGNCSVRCKKIRSEEGYVTIKNATVQAIGGAIAADDGIKLIGVSVLYGYPDGYKEIVEEKRDGDRSKMYYLVNGWGGLLHEVVIGPSGAPSQPTIGNGDEIFMTPSPDSKKEFPAIGGDIQQEFLVNILSLRYSASPQVIEKPDWIVAWRKGDRTFKTILSAVPNYGEARSGDVVFLINGFRKTYKFSQLGGADSLYVDVELTPREVSAEAGGMEFDATIRNKRGYVTCLTLYPFTPDAKDWLTITSGETLGYHEKFDFHIKVAPNTGPERKGTVSFVTTNGSEVLTIHQAANFTLEPKELDAGPMRDDYEVTLSCNVPYHIDDLNKPDWLSVSGNSSGSEAIQKMTIAVKPNTSLERTAGIIFRTDKGDVRLKVTQAAAGTKPEPEKAVFTLEPKELKVETGGGKKEVTLSCNQAFELNKVTVPSWMERVPSSATSDEKSRVCAFNIQKNTGPERKGEIVFHTDKGDVTLKVTQAGKKEKPDPKPQDPEPTLTVSATSVTFPPEGGDPKIIPVKSSHGWSVERDVSKGTGDWITFGEQPEGLYISVEENTGTRQRAVQLFVISDKNLKNGQPLKRTVLVTQQAQKPAAVAATGISLNPAAITMGSGGGMVGFNVYASKGWTISGSPDWMHPDATRGSGTRLVIVRFDRNESGAERTGKLTVKSDDGKAERTFTLTQRASQRKPSRPSDDGTYDYDLALNPEEITVGPSEGAGSSISVVTSRLWAGSTTEDWIRLESAVGRGNG
ncbi:MAG: BACON domain-containing protein, partial [Tannerella sp.]